VLSAAQLHREVQRSPYAAVPPVSLGPPVNDQGYYVGLVERNLYWVTDGDYHSAFLATHEGVVPFDRMEERLRAR
jgi:hypothetical protein